MKKLASVFLVLMFMFSFTACGSATTNSTGTSDEASSALLEENKNTEVSSEDRTTDTGKTLVVYFSATGSTKAVAETIAKATDGDLFEVTPVDPYTEEDLAWTNEDSRVNTEHNDEGKQDVALIQTTPDHWEDYDTVFVGYPIWWGMAAWPVNNFVTGNDFAGKTVIPFCTSASSELGESGTHLAALAGSGTWLDGKRFASGASVSEIESWVATLNL